MERDRRDFGGSDAAPILRAARTDDASFQYALFCGRRGEPFRLSGVPAQLIDELMSMQFRSRKISYAQAYPDARWLIAECAGERLGELVLAVGAHTAHIVDITLAPERQRRGLGRAVLQAALRDLAPRRETSALIELTNTPSRKMFASLGFVERAYDDIHVAAISTPPQDGS